MSEQKLFGTNKHWIENEADGCIFYEPCPICNKCMAKASHLYIPCQDCKVPKCVHTEKQRSLMIRRENFTLENPSEELQEALRQLSKGVN